MAESLNLKAVWGSKGAKTVTCNWSYKGPGGPTQNVGTVSRTYTEAENGTIQHVGTAFPTPTTALQYNPQDPVGVCATWASGSFLYTSTGYTVENAGTGLFEIRDVSIMLLAAFVGVVVMWAAYKHLLHMIGLLSSPDDEDEPVLRWEDDEGRERWQLKGRTRYRMDQ